MLAVCAVALDKLVAVERTGFSLADFGMVCHPAAGRAKIVLHVFKKFPRSRRQYCRWGFARQLGPLVWRQAISVPPLIH